MRSIRTSTPMPACWSGPAAPSGMAQDDFTPQRLAAEIASACGGAAAARGHGGGGQVASAGSTPPTGWPTWCCRWRQRAQSSSFGSALERGDCMKLPRDIGPVHFVGIGGIGMSGIAEVLVESRLRGAGLRRGRQRQRQAAARQGRRRSPSAMTPRTSTAPRSSSSPRRSSATIRSSPPRARSACRWCAAPRCWPS